MDNKQKSAFRVSILDKLKELDTEDVLGQHGQKTVELEQQAVGRLSRQDALLAQSMSKATQTRRDALRKGLNAALARIDEDEFGYCEECGEDIAIKRLVANPAVTRCMSCASG